MRLPPRSHQGLLPLDLRNEQRSDRRFCNRRDRRERALEERLESASHRYRTGHDDRRAHQAPPRRHRRGNVHVHLRRRAGFRRRRRRSALSSRKGPTGDGRRRASAGAVRRARYRRRSRRVVFREAAGLRGLDQRRLLRLRTRHLRSYRRRRDPARTRTARGPGGGGSALGLLARRLLAADGHAARQTPARRVVGDRLAAVGART